MRLWSSPDAYMDGYFYLQADIFEKNFRHSRVRANKNICRLSLSKSAVM